MRPIIGLTIATMFNILGMAIIIPVLPFHILSLGGSAFQATVIYSVFSGVSVITVWFWGSLSDRFGRKSILCLGIGVTAFSYVWLAVADSLWQIYAARALAGAFAAWLPVSQAFVGDVITPQKRAAAMGMLGAAFGVGFTLGPAIGGYLASMSIIESQPYALPYVLATCMAVVCLMLALILIREPVCKTASSLAGSQAGSWSDFDQYRHLLPVIGLYFGVSLLFTGIEGVLTVWSQATLHWQPKDVGIALMVAGLGSIVTQGYLIRVATHKIGEAHTILLALVLLLSAFIGLSFNAASLTTILLLLILAVSMGLHNPAMQSLISQLAPEEKRGRIMGIAQAAASFARVCGPIWAGLIFGHFAGNTPFYAGTVLAFILVIGGYVVMRPHQRKNQSE